VIGQQFGNYRLTKLLGEGGFARVYLGEHIHLGTQAAVKVLTTKLTHEGIAQFRNEARLMIGMDHPHIVRVLDFGMQGTIPFLVMAYAPCGSLRTMHPRGSRLSLSQIVAYINQMAAALQYIHDQRLIHRDVKPENMLVSQRGIVALSDFGIAVVAHSERSLSQKADVGGTGVYMAPEQFQGKPRTASDQYALGIVMYEWLVGTPPFRGNIAELAYQHVSMPPRPLHEQIAISSAVEDVILKALEKDPQQRYLSVQDFALALEQASHMKREIRSSGKTKNPPSLSTMPPPMPQPVPALLSVLQAGPHQSSPGSTQRASGGRPFAASHPPLAFQSPFPSTEQAFSSAGKGESFSVTLRTPSFCAPLPSLKKKSWLRVLPIILIIGVFLVVSSGALSTVIALTRGFSQTSITSVSSESETTATTFLNDVAQQDYNRAYVNLDASLTLVMTSLDFAKQAQATDHCYGPIIRYTEATSTVKNGQQSLIYTVTRNRFPHAYNLNVILQQDPGSGKWLISSYGKNDDLGPAPSAC
jgi:serine/threonine protein kinase